MYRSKKETILYMKAHHSHLKDELKWLEDAIKYLEEEDIKNG